MGRIRDDPPIGQLVKIYCDPAPTMGIVYDVGRIYIYVLLEDGTQRHCYRSEVMPTGCWTWLESDVHNGGILERGQYCIYCRRELARTRSHFSNLFRHMDSGMVMCVEKVRHTEGRNRRLRRRAPAKAPVRKVPILVAIKPKVTKGITKGNVEIETCSGRRRVVTQK